MAAATQPLEAQQARPPCPKCGSASQVQKHGSLTRRTTGQKVLMWGCVKCRRWFMDSYLGRSGRLPNLEKRKQALRLRRRGLSYTQIAKEMGIKNKGHAYRLAHFVFATSSGVLVGRRVVLRIRPEAVQGLREIYSEHEKTNRPLSLSEFAAELFEDAIISRRSKKVTP
jgi:transposase-like protein